MTTPAIPQFLIPSSPGQLSNYFGANTAADKITLQARYANPEASAEGLGSVRAVATRIRAGGTQSETIWDSWYSSTGNQQKIPNAGNIDGPMASALYGGRLYVLQSASSGGGSSKFFSAPIAGNSVGTWRIESAPLVPGTTTILSIASLVILNGVIYVLAYNATASGIYYAPIGGNGIVGSWTLLLTQPTGLTLSTGRFYLTGYTDTTGAWLIVLGAATSSYVAVAKTGVISGSWATTTNLPRTATDPTQAGGIFIQPSGNNDGLATLWLIGGATGTAPTVPVSTVTSAALTSGNISGAFATAGTGLPAARSNFGFSVSGPGTSNNYTLVVLGGNSTTAYGGGNASSTANQQTAVYKISASSLGGAWTTVAGSLGTAVDGCAGAFVGNLSGATDWGVADVYAVSGNVVVAGYLDAIQHSHWTASFPAFTNSATGTAATTSDLGTGSALTTNANGTIDATFLWNAFGVAALLSLLNGDTVTVALTFVSTLGDPSPTGYTVFKVGQPPTVTSITATPTGDGEPLIAFNYNGGLGGASEQYWRVQVYPAQPYYPVVTPSKRWLPTRQPQYSGTSTQSLIGKRGQRFSFNRKTASPGFYDPPGISTLLDSGVIVGSLNSWQTQPAPMLSGVQQQAWVTVASQDVPMPGSTNIGAAGAVIAGAAYLNGAPSNVALVVDNTNGYMTLSWTTSTAGTPGSGSARQINRVYYRVTGTTAWTLYKDNIPTAPTQAGTLVMMDQLKLDGTSYDFYVSEVSVSHGESDPSQATVVSGAFSINYQWPSGFSAMLHVQGTLGPTTHVGLFLPTGSVKITRMQDTQSDVYFGDTAERYRYGIYTYREIELALSQTITLIPGLDTVLTSAYAGNTLCYRDVAGNLIYCGFQGQRARVYDYYADETLKLTEAAFTYAP